jgi:hypothetical protein
MNIGKERMGEDKIRRERKGREEEMSIGKRKIDGRTEEKSIV